MTPIPEKIEELMGEKEGKMDELLSKMEINYNAVEQEALSKKYFELSDDKNQEIEKQQRIIIQTSRWLGGILFVFLASFFLREQKEVSSQIFITVSKLAIGAPFVWVIMNASKRMKRAMDMRDQYIFKGSAMSAYRNISAHIKAFDIDINKDKQIGLLNRVFAKNLENEANKQWEIQELRKKED